MIVIMVVGEKLDDVVDGETDLSKVPKSTIKITNAMYLNRPPSEDAVLFLLWNLTCRQPEERYQFLRLCVFFHQRKRGDRDMITGRPRAGQMFVADCTETWLGEDNQKPWYKEISNFKSQHEN